jgi:FkbM family methyltransferase
VNKVRVAIGSLMWLVVAPIRIYIRLSPIALGKWRLVKMILEPVLSLFPAGMTLFAPVPGGHIPLLYSEDLGKTVLIKGSFEAAEISAIVASAEPGSCVADVGANVGLFSIALARKVAPAGKVFAFEPLPANAERLRRNCENNRVSTVIVYQVALAEHDGVIALRLGSDPAYGSTVEVRPGKASGETLTVTCRTLDGVWREAGRPRMSAVKIDVEGAELSVLSGARELLAECGPVLLIEAASTSAINELSAWLDKFGYVRHQRPGFEPWNHLFMRGDRL